MSYQKTGVDASLQIIRYPKIADERNFIPEHLMRIHVALPKATTVSIDDDLIALLGAVLALPNPELHANAKRQLSLARHFIRSVAEGYDGQLRDGLSRTVQRAIFRRIANPQALVILDERDTDEAKARAEAAHLENCARNNWLTPAHVAERKHQKLKRAEAKRRRKARAAVEDFSARRSSSISISQ